MEERLDGNKTCVLTPGDVPYKSAILTIGRAVKNRAQYAMLQKGLFLNTHKLSDEWKQEGSAKVNEEMVYAYNLLQALTNYTNSGFLVEYRDLMLEGMRLDGIVPPQRAN